MMAASFIMLVAALIAFVAHVARLGEAFLALMVLFGVLGFTGAWLSRNRARAFVDARQDERRAALNDSFHEPRP